MAHLKEKHIFFVITTQLSLCLTEFMDSKSLAHVELLSDKNASRYSMLLSL